jgi:hypothetical protein
VPPQHEQIQPPRRRVDLKRRRISITGCAGALMDLTIPKNAGYSGYTVRRKPRLDILRH